VASGKWQVVVGGATARLATRHPLKSDVERFAAAALGFDVGVVELEAFVQAFTHEIQFSAFQIAEALRVDEDGDAVTLELGSSGSSVSANSSL
jgi:hypothetical protein